MRRCLSVGRAWRGDKTDHQSAEESTPLEFHRIALGESVGWDCGLSARFAGEWGPRTGKKKVIIAGPRIQWPFHLGSNQGLRMPGGPSACQECPTVSTALTPFHSTDHENCQDGALWWGQADLSNWAVGDQRLTTSKGSRARSISQGRSAATSPFVFLAPASRDAVLPGSTATLASLRSTDGPPTQPTKKPIPRKLGPYPGNVSRGSLLRPSPSWSTSRPRCAGSCRIDPECPRTRRSPAR